MCASSDSIDTCVVGMSLSMCSAVVVLCEYVMYAR